MKSNPVKSLHEVMAHYGYSIPGMNFLGSDNAPGDIAAFCDQQFFSKSDAEIIADMIAVKNHIYSNLYKIDFCPFESLTGVNWEEMFIASIAPPNNFTRIPIKTPTAWFHMILSSGDFFHQSLQITKSKCPLIVHCDYIAKEMVKINDTQYTYGEAKVIVERQEIHPNRDPFHIRLHHSALVIDSRLIDELKSEKEYNEVIERLYFLFHLSGHSALIHSLFLETTDYIRAKIKNDQVMYRLTEEHYFGYDMYEMNYIRMMKRIYDIICKHNSTLSHDLNQSVYDIHCLTEHWSNTLKEYIRSVALMRADRLEDFTMRTEHILTYIEGPLKEGGMHTAPTGLYISAITHKLPEKEAIVHDKYYRGPVLEIPFSSMTRFMFDLYTKNHQSSQKA